jgi:hypothetical protein
MRWLATTVVFLLPLAAAAEQFEYGLRTNLGWTDNVFGSADDAQTVQLQDTNGDGIADTNVLVDVDKVDDWSLRLSPWGQVADPDGDVTWSLRYMPSYEYYLHESDLRDFDHDANANVSWRVGDRTYLFASEAYQQYRSLVRFNQETTQPTDPAVFRSRRDKLVSNVFSAGIRHHVTPRDLFLMNGTYNFRDYDNEASTDRWTTVLGTRYQHSLTERTTIGLTGSWIRQTFERDFGNEVVTNYYNLSGLLEHQFSRTLSLSISAGPTLIDPDQDVENFSPRFGVRQFGASTIAIDADDPVFGCPLQNDALPEQPDPDLPNFNPRVSSLGFGSCGSSSANTISSGEAALLGYPRGAPLEPGGTLQDPRVKLTSFDDPFEVNGAGELVDFDDSDVGDSEVTYFARVALKKDWELWKLELAYERANDDSGSFGTSSVQDSFEASLRWEPAPLWTVSLSGVYTLIDQATDVPIPTGSVVANEPAPAGVDSVTEVAAVQRLIVESSSDAISYDTTSLALTATRQLTRTSRGFISLYWYQQNQHLDLPSDFSFNPTPVSGADEDSTWNTFTVWIGVDWNFGTIKF